MSYTNEANLWSCKCFTLILDFAYSLLTCKKSEMSSPPLRLSITKGEIGWKQMTESSPQRSRERNEIMRNGLVRSLGKMLWMKKRV